MQGHQSEQVRCVVRLSSSVLNGNITGCEQYPLNISHDLVGDSQEEMMAGQYYLDASSKIGLVLSRMYEENFPAFFQRHKKAFLAGRWYRTLPGPWLGMAVVYKLQTHVHVDQGDGLLPVAIFCVGQFTGGFLEMPDLNLRFLQVSFSYDNK